MGFFSKIKENFNRGGVSIGIVAPQRVAKGENNVQVQVRLAAGDKTQTIKSVSAVIERYYVGNAENDERSDGAAMAIQENNTPFELQAGQSVYLDFNLVLNQANSSPAMQQLANVINKLGKTYDTMKQRSFFHQVKVVADVDGIAIDPSASQKIIIEGQEDSRIEWSIT